MLTTYLKGTKLSDFNDFSRQQLIEAAERFGISVDGRWNMENLIGRLIQNGVTVDQIKGANEILDVTEGGGVDDDAISQFGDTSPSNEKQVVLKMDRPNRSYSIIGHRFTSDHPFIVMPEEEALWIIDTVDGFRIAHPTEAAKFYKGR